jgi:D-alanyl-lipoteichoic acid acyltransferase DltB (MBOAT superfamily)
MLFNSLHFLVFFPIVAFVYFCLRRQPRVYWLVAASCYFYMVFVPSYILILFFLIALDYSAGLLIARSEGRARKLYLVASILGNVGMLAFFKYYHFVDQNIASVARGIGLTYTPSQWNILLPIGLSFHTFQSMSYVIEVYRGNYPAERSLSTYALYVLFFPQMVAGPIERPQNLLAQLHYFREFDHHRVVSGLLVMLLGFFKKVVIADRFAMVVSSVYGDPAAHSSVELIVATYCFAFQIYCDFSGYSDIAIGAARILGYDLRVNFDRPYAARSISEFWRRWHISLSSWFRDYLYIPLGGSHVPRWRWSTNLLVVFMVSGLWHGANWTFVCWGALHGCYLIASIWTEPARARLRSSIGLDAMPKARAVLQTVTTFHLVLIGWVFFRASSVADAVTILARFIGARGGPVVGPGIGLPAFDLLVGVAALVALELFEWAARDGDWTEWVQPQPIWVRWPVYYAAFFAILLLGKFSSQEFIYFQF